MATRVDDDPEPLVRTGAPQIGRIDKGADGVELGHEGVRDARRLAGRPEGREGAGRRREVGNGGTRSGRARRRPGDVGRAGTIDSNRIADVGTGSPEKRRVPERGAGTVEARHERVPISAEEQLRREERDREIYGERSTRHERVSGQVDRDGEPDVRAGATEIRS